MTPGQPTGPRFGAELVGLAGVAMCLVACDRPGPPPAPTLRPQTAGCLAGELMACLPGNECEFNICGRGETCLIYTPPPGRVIVCTPPDAGPPPTVDAAPGEPTGEENR